MFKECSNITTETFLFGEGLRNFKKN